jgi:hypothetical protein
LSLSIALLFAVASSSVISAATISDNFEKGAAHSGDALRPSEMEAKYPISPEDEAAIVHEIPPCPVIIDGVRYQAEEINLFNGQRLRFAIDAEGTLFAFTTAKGLEDFVEKEYGPVFDRMAEAGPSSTGLDVSLFFIDVWYMGGEPMIVAPGTEWPQLEEYNNAISSAKICDTSGAYLYDYEYFGGSYLYLAPGTSHSVLMFDIFHYFNDRASSIKG